MKDFHYHCFKNYCINAERSFSQFKGAICNIPIEIANIANTLPQMSRQ